jgi:hypothetical protein
VRYFTGSFICLIPGHENRPETLRSAVNSRKQTHANSDLHIDNAAIHDHNSTAPAAVDR